MNEGIITPYAEFLHKKLYLIEYVTGCLFKGDCNEEKLKKNMMKIRNICHMSNSAVEEMLEGLRK